MTTKCAYNLFIMCVLKAIVLDMFSFLHSRWNYWAAVVVFSPCSLFNFFCFVFSLVVGSAFVYHTYYKFFFCNVCRAFCTVHLLSFSVPAGAGGGAAGKRRHSYQSGVPGLAKDMDRLRVSAAAANAANQGVNQGRSPRGSTRRRASSARRSSRSGNSRFNFSFVQETNQSISRLSAFPGFGHCQLKFRNSRCCVA